MDIADKMKLQMQKDLISDAVAEPDSFDVTEPAGEQIMQTVTEGATDTVVTDIGTEALSMVDTQINESSGLKDAKNEAVKGLLNSMFEGGELDEEASLDTTPVRESVKVTNTNTLSTSIEGLDEEIADKINMLLDDLL